VHGFSPFFRCEDVVPRERDGVVIAIFCFSYFNQRRELTLISDYICNQIREDSDAPGPRLTNLASGASLICVSYVVAETTTLHQGKIRA
jgi:hypothetical protein